MPQNAGGPNMTVAVLVGDLAGLAGGVAGYFIARPWGFEITGVVVGLCVGVVAGLVLYQKLRKTL